MSIPPPLPSPDSSPAGAGRRSQPAVERAWCLYDFGNSSFALLFPAIFGTWYAASVVGSGTEGDAAWGRLVSASMLLVAIAAPFLGGIADHAGRRKHLLLTLTSCGCLAVLCFSLLQPGDALLGFVVGVAANFAFEGAIVFYNAYLPDIAPTERQGRLSARGYAWGYVGSLLGLLVALPFLEAKWLMGVWFAVALQWAFGGWIAWRGLPRDVPREIGLVAAARAGGRGAYETLRTRVWGTPIGKYLLAYFFFMNALLTIINFAPRFAQATLGFEPRELLALMALVQATALVGSAAVGGPIDRHGPQRVLRVLLLLWLATIVATFFVQSKLMFYGVASVAGVGLGSVQAAARTEMARLVPNGEEARLFGFYALCGKSGAILGPLVFGEVSRLLGDRRYGVLSVGVLLLLGWAILGRSKSAAAPAMRREGEPSPQE